MPLLDEIKTMTGITDDEYLNVMIPILVEQANDETNQSYAESEVPAGYKLFIKKAIEYNRNDNSLAGRSMGSVSYTYNTQFPTYILNDLKPYKKLRWPS